MVAVGASTEKNQEARNTVKNKEQVEEFKLASRELWEKKFCSWCPKDWPDFDKDTKMCACWHIKGDCFDACPHAISHIPGSMVMPNQKNEFLTFMTKCRDCPPVENKRRDDTNARS